MSYQIWGDLYGAQQVKVARRESNSGMEAEKFSSSG